MSALMVAFVRVHDLEAYNREYLFSAHPLIEKYNGKALAVSEKVKPIQGKLPEGKFVILEFPTTEQAEAYYYSAEHQALLEKGNKYFSSDSIIAENELHRD
ncbi:DUF1330 domain-containing protein [Photobacterium sp. OFAV2-7]|uniref:DUF1330 domain-containing protein n=1 Tax=Photobacterium sp. OFAV2-7 TaxID=2917748 RepID=UPI001EF5FAAD|nr:DUF1330 domain-containing protein [Photobacterium sp. OFAV2-7]MCG7586275.1 DUF1330 domain-containing protein [Photobacterium sp. OFAV2-7]